MTFKNKWKVRNWSLSLLHFIYGFTGFALAMIWIKWEKFDQFRHFLFKPEYLGEEHAELIAHTFYKSDVSAWVWFVPVALVLDSLIQKYLIKNEF